MSSPAPRAVLLDALGTLVALEPPAPRLRAQLADRFGVRISLEAATTAIAAEIGYYRAHLQDGRDEASLAELRLSCARVLREALPDDARPRLPGGEQLVETLLASLRFDPFADALTALPRLRAEGRRLVVVSNWDASLHEVLERVGIAASVDAILTSAEAGSRKPDVAIFERALELAEAPADDAIHVGDSPGEDVAGALAAGVEPVLIDRAATGSPPAPPSVRTIASLDELVG
jgi:putative hydrolase of the HAD superfamily